MLRGWSGTRHLIPLPVDDYDNGDASLHNAGSDTDHLIDRPAGVLPRLSGRAACNQECSNNEER